VAQQVSFVDTSVDRITPRTTEADRAEVAAQTGFADLPQWSRSLSGTGFSVAVPGGRPAWEEAGAWFVADLEPWQRRKLYLLNGAQSLLAFAGQLRGHGTVAEAIADPGCAEQVRRSWDAVAPLLPGPGIDVYREQLLDRFANPVIRRELRQIAADAVPKLRARAVGSTLQMPETEAAAFILAVWWPLPAAPMSGPCSASSTPAWSSGASSSRPSTVH
jgi:fructuronate reductase